MNGNYPAGADNSFAPWNEEEVDITAYCEATVGYGIKKDVELECETKAFVHGCNIDYEIYHKEWEDIDTKTTLPPDVLISKMADALTQYMDATKEPPSYEYVQMLLKQAKGWECDGYKSFDVISEYCDY